MWKIVVRLISLALLVLPTGKSMAQDERVDLVRACSAALIKSELSFEKDLALVLSILNTVDQDNFSEAQKSFDWDAIAEISGVPFSSAMSFDRFQSERKSFFSRYEYKENRNESVSYSSTRLGPDALEAYKSCLKSVASENYGFYAWIEDYDDETVEIRASWKLPDGASGDAGFGMKLKHGTHWFPSQADLPTTISPGVTERFIISVTDRKKFKAYISGAGELITLAMPQVPSFNVPCEDVSKIDTFVFDVHEGSVHKKICNKCSDCREVSHDHFRREKIDLACIGHVQVAERRALRAEGFDCSWNNAGSDMQQISYGKDLKLINVLAGSELCKRLSGNLTDLGLKTPPAFCR